MDGLEVEYPNNDVVKAMRRRLKEEHKQRRHELQGLGRGEALKPKSW